MSIPGAGYGKSTAISLYFSDQKERCCWYSISSMDDDMLPFLSYLIASIRINIPEFGVELEKYINEMDRYVREQELNLLCSLFINEVLAIKQELVLILDDFHQVAHSNPVNRWMEILLDHLPNNLHLIVLSRNRPDWKSFTRMKAMGAVLEITKEDLVLTKEEVELLLNEIYGMTLSQIELDHLYELTEGWVIALGLIAGQTKEYQRLKSGLREHSQSLKDLFRYLAMEVLAKQKSYIQGFLLQSSILEEMNKEVCNAILNVSDSQSLLDELTERNLFIQRVAEHGYRYHALFREFLEEQLRANQNYSFEKLNIRAAQHFQQKDMLEKSLYHYEKINQITAIANLLQDNGVRLLESGKLEGLFERLVKIPDSQKDGTSTLWFLQGEIHRYLVKLPRSRGMLRSSHYGSRKTSGLSCEK
ncbi:hypothetical protein [Bacillus sp. T3]|uniref:hypothetical protein n=1 Tax=Bacillus sp. T3 TaxID=467262 RepID=UPI002981054B|nr:hypothetical protein [Bacillus sp. T3]